MDCSICCQQAKTRHIDLYVFGSEGLHLCRPCENELSKLAFDLALKKQRQRKAKYLAGKPHITQSIKEDSVKSYNLVMCKVDPDYIKFSDNIDVMPAEATFVKYLSRPMSLDTLTTTREILEDLGFEVCIDLGEYFYESPSIQTWRDKED